MQYQYLNLIVRYKQQGGQFRMTKMTQSEIDDLLNDSQANDESSFHQVKVRVVQPAQTKTKQKIQQSYSYANQEFDEYQESRKTQSMQQSYSQSLSTKPVKRQKQKQKNKPLAQIKEQQTDKKSTQKKQTNKGSELYIKPALQLGTQSKFNKKKGPSQISNDRSHLAYNYARLQQRQRQLLLTTLTEQNKKLKADIAQRANNYKKLENKYKMLLEQKTQHTSTAKELALQKKLVNMQTKLQQMANLKKISQDRQKYKTKISKDPGNFIPQQQANRRQTELLQLIDKLKHRLVESDENMGVLKKKLNEGVEHNDQLHRKMKRVEQLQYKMQKMTEQAQTDRGYIDILKQKIKQLEKQVEAEKSKNRKLDVELKRMEMGQYTHADILKQLQQTRRQKQMLEKSLKQLSSTMMSNVRKNYQNVPKNNIEDSQQLLRVQSK